MPNMNNAQAMVVSPILTTIALGYKNAAYVGQNLFPRVTVRASSGKVLKFNRDRYKRTKTDRAPGANVPSISPRYGADQYALVKHDLDGKVPIELWTDANAVPSLDLGTMAVQEARDVLEFGLEIEQADLARNAALYPSTNKEVLSGTARWSQSASTPLEDIADAREAVRGKIGVYPNTLVLSAKAKRALRFHAQFIDRIKYSTGGVVNDALIAALTEIPRVFTAADQLVSEDDTTVTDLWGADAILAYVPETIQSAATPSYGYTYTMAGYPTAYTPFWHSDTRSWKYPESDWRAPVLAGQDAGFLLVNAGDNS